GGAPVIQRRSAEHRRHPEPVDRDGDPLRRDDDGDAEHRQEGGQADRPHMQASPPRRHRPDRRRRHRSSHGVQGREAMSHVAVPSRRRGMPTMDLAAELARHRDFLIGVAYRLLGSMHAAEDVVQDAYLRAERAGTDEVREPRAWMTRIVTRLALDELRSARVRREAYVGPWLPEPLVAPVDEQADPADRVTPDDQRSLALLTVPQT